MKTKTYSLGVITFITIIVSISSVGAFCKVTGYVTPVSGYVTVYCNGTGEYKYVDGVNPYLASFGGLMDDCDICDPYIYVNATNASERRFGENRMDDPNGDIVQLNITMYITAPFIEDKWEVVESLPTWNFTSDPPDIPLGSNVTKCVIVCDNGSVALSQLRVYANITDNSTGELMEQENLTRTGLIYPCNETIPPEDLERFMEKYNNETCDVWSGNFTVDLNYIIGYNYTLHVEVMGPEWPGNPDDYYERDNKFHIVPEPMAILLFSAGLSLLYGLVRVIKI